MGYTEAGVVSLGSTGAVRSACVDEATTQGGATSDAKKECRVKRGIVVGVAGVAMAVAVLIDATIVRGVLLPAGLALLGDRAWSSRGGRRTTAHAVDKVLTPQA